MEYYNYAERQADSQIDWAVVGKNITTTLEEQNKIREEKKDAIDTATHYMEQNLANAPQGEYRPANQFMLEYAANASDYMRIQTQLLKSGKLPMKQYIANRQNVYDGTDNMFATMKEYQAQYSDAMARLQSGKSQPLEGFVLQGAEAFGNFKDTKVFINPNDGTVSVGKLVQKTIDGKTVTTMSDDPNDFTTISSLRNRVRTKYDKLNTYVLLDDQVKRLGKETQVLREVGDAMHLGSIVEIMDITKRGIPSKLENGHIVTEEQKGVLTQFQKAEDSFLDSMLAQPTNISSVLTANMKNNPETGQPYTFTWDANDKDENKILLRNINDVATPIFDETPAGKKQREAAKDFLRTQFESMLDRTVTMKTVIEPKPPVAKQYKQSLWEYKLAHGMSLEHTPGTKLPKDVTDFSESMDGYLTDTIKPEVMKLSEEDAAPIIQETLRPFGFKVEQTAVGANKLLVTGTNGATLEVDLDVPDEEKQKQIDALKAFVRVNTPKAVMGDRVAVGKLYPYAKKVPGTPTPVEGKPTVNYKDK